MSLPAPPKFSNTAVEDSADQVRSVHGASASSTFLLVACETGDTDSCT